MNETQRAEGWRGRRRGPGTAVAVIAIHLLLALALWHAMRTRQVTVAPERSALLWLRPSPAPRPAPVKTPAAIPTKRPREPSPPVAPPVSAVAPSHESTWVQTPPPVAATPSASAASTPPTERLLDTEATRIAIRQTGRQPLLHERATQATGTPIQRSDTALAGAVAEAGTPDCLKDGQAASGQVGPIGLGGLLGLPFLAARVATGKCAK